MELAMDIAIQAAPDHPYVKAHPEWFRHSPDGTIKYAENPPKKYQDIYPIDFVGEDPPAREALWLEWKRIFEVWIERGVKIFRVDNPHTKPIPFWAWLIARDPARPSRGDLPVGGVHEAEDDAAAGQGRLHPELHLLHLARVAGRAARLPDRADPDRDARVLPRQPVRQHARHQPAPPRPRPAGVRDPQRAGGHALEPVRHLLRLGAVRGRRGSASARSTSTRRSTRSGRATGTRRATSSS